MKILKIENKKAYFRNNFNVYKGIREINKNNVYEIMKTIFDSDNPNDLYDDFDENVTIINNPAEKIIYENLIKHLKEFISTIPEIKVEINDMFKDFE